MSNTKITMEGKIYHVTKEKLAELQKEHAELVALDHQKTMGEEAPKMIESDEMNAEFVSFQENMDALRGRINELEGIFKNHQIITAPPKEKAMFVDLGAKVQIHVDGKADEFMIVGTLEANPVAGKISNESPVGKALLGKKIGDDVVVPLASKKTYKIKNISYEIG